jgi:hypothetical protein
VSGVGLAVKVGWARFRAGFRVWFEIGFRVWFMVMFRVMFKINLGHYGQDYA